MVSERLLPLHLTLSPPPSLSPLYPHCLPSTLTLSPLMPSVPHISYPQISPATTTTMTTTASTPGGIGTVVIIAVSVGGGAALFIFLFVVVLAVVCLCRWKSQRSNSGTYSEPSLLSKNARIRGATRGHTVSLVYSARMLEEHCIGYYCISSNNLAPLIACHTFIDVDGTVSSSTHLLYFGGDFMSPFQPLHLASMMFSIGVRTATQHELVSVKSHHPFPFVSSLIPR